MSKNDNISPVPRDTAVPRDAVVPSDEPLFDIGDIKLRVKPKKKRVIIEFTALKPGIIRFIDNYEKHIENAETVYDMLGYNECWNVLRPFMSKKQNNQLKTTRDNKVYPPYFLCGTNGITDEIISIHKKKIKLHKPGMCCADIIVDLLKKSFNDDMVV